MKLFLYIFTFFTFAVQAQESKPKFHEQLYLEPNVGVGSFQTVDDYVYETFESYPSLSGSLGLYYRNSLVKTGLDFNYFFPLYMPSIRFQTSVNFHKLLSVKPSKYFFCGPILGVGYSKSKYFGGFPYFSTGLDTYFHNFHFAIKFDYMVTIGYLHYLKKANVIYLELGYSIHLGKKKTRKNE